MKETADMDILIKSTTGDTKIMQSTRVTSRPTKRIMKWNVQPVQMNYQGRNHRKYLSCVHFNNQQRVQEGQQLKNQKSYMPYFVANLTF